MNKLRQLSWKQKNRLLFIGFLLLCWIIYGFAVSNTLQAKSECERLQLQLDSATGAPERLASLRAKLEQLNVISGTSETAQSDSTVHEELLNLVSEYCGEHALVLREFLLPVEYEQEDWHVETHPFTVEGNFREIVLLLEYLRKQVPGKPVSADIHTRTDPKLKVTSLLVTIYVQHLTTRRS